MSSKIKELNQKYFDADFEDIDENINLFLTLYNRLMPKRTSFSQAVRSFIVFNQVI